MIQLRQGLTLGQGAPVRVNCNIGCNTKEGYNNEQKKITAIKESKVLPDMMMDLSLVELEIPLYKDVIEILGIPVGTVLSYKKFSKRTGLDWESTRNYLVKLCKDGVSFVTIHFTADIDLLELAKSQRKIPMTSRGGGIVLYDQKLNKREFNLFRQHIDEIADIVKSYDVAISLGTTFRPATIFDSCDEVHAIETSRQLELCKYLQSKHVKVIIENIGHISLDKLEKHSLLLKQFDAPVMPLGPLPTDSAENIDHINNAIGASFAGYWGCAHIINCVTRYEHSNAGISIDVMIEAIKTAKLAAHIINVSNGVVEDLSEDLQLVNERSSHNDCIHGNEQCNRCSDVCPLKLL